MHSEQAAPDLLQKSLDASGVGWWQLDFGQREMTCSRLAADLFGADRTRISFEEVYLLPGEEHRARIYTRCAALKVSDSLDETFVTANGDRCLQVRAVAAANDPLTGVRSVFGTVRRVTESTPENAELASINQSYKATQRNYSHLAQLIEHLPIGSTCASTSCATNRAKRSTTCFRTSTSRPAGYWASTRRAMPERRPARWE